MTERLMGFLFCGVLVAVAVNLAADKIHARIFPQSLWFQAHWFVPFVIVPAAALLALAFSFGFFRPGGRARPMRRRFCPLPCWSTSPWARAIPAGITASSLLSPARSCSMPYRFAT